MRPILIPLQLLQACKWTFHLSSKAALRYAQNTRAEEQEQSGWWQRWGWEKRVCKKWLEFQCPELIFPTWINAVVILCINYCKDMLSCLSLLMRMEQPLCWQHWKGHNVNPLTQFSYHAGLGLCWGRGFWLVSASCKAGQSKLICLKAEPW